MAEERPKRANAGSKIGSLVNQELKDDFYSTAYGGFEEDSNDDEYESEHSEEDEVDSDFDVDESAWGPEEDAEEKLQKEMKAHKKKSWIKPYKDPLSSSSSVKPLKKPRLDTAAPATPPPGPGKATVSTVTKLGTSRNLRRSTQEISRGFRMRLEEEQHLRKRRRRRGNFRDQDRKMSQEELLEEAKWTEMENLASLEAYTKMEEERRKVKVKKKPWTGPAVRFLSLTMPVVTDGDVGERTGGEERGPGLEGARGGEKSLDGELLGSLGSIGGGETKEVRFVDGSDKMDGSQLSFGGTTSHTRSSPMDMSMSSRVSIEQADKPNLGNEHIASEDTTALTLPTDSTQQPTQKTQPEVLRQSRNFLIFTDTSKYPSEYFPSVRPQKPKRRLCPVTRLPAKYIDPLTRTPYATPFAFKVIRTRYVNEAEQKCEQRLLQLSSWLEEKKKKKMEVS